MSETTILWRPCGAAELALVAASKWLRWPERLPWQPYFYPVLNEGYAREITRWNVADEGIGHVTRFHAQSAALAAYPVRCVGGPEHLELWIPAAELPALNAALVGPIELWASYS